MNLRFVEFSARNCQRGLPVGWQTCTFTRIFGEGTAEKIFADVPDNCTKYDEVYCSFFDYVHDQKAAGEQKRSEILAKYTPNRQQRRAK